MAGHHRTGRVKDITAHSNPEVKAAKALHLKKHRVETGSFLAEGAKLAIDALDAGWTVERLFVAKAVLDEPHIAKIVTRALSAGADVLTVPEAVIGGITRRDNPQAIVSVIRERLAPLTALGPLKTGDTLVALDRVRDPGNLGTVIRTADAAGAKGVVLVGECVDLFSLETVRATMGSLFALPVAKAAPDQLTAFVRAQDAMLVGTHLKGARDYRAIDYRGKPVIILMGNEQSGLPDGLAAQCDALALIPQQGKADSLNLGVATGLMLYEARRHLLGCVPA
ncbi:MAG: RNA methyltransferase [Rhizobiaceae bacterium]|jgi:TrmH family RNA methyltransferase|nr:RNA methyltransferase [Rhizobiaceae bacterium]